MVRPENTLEDQLSIILPPASLQFISLICYLTSVKLKKILHSLLSAPSNGVRTPADGVFPQSLFEVAQVPLVHFPAKTKNTYLPLYERSEGNCVLHCQILKAQVSLINEVYM